MPKGSRSRKNSRIRRGFGKTTLKRSTNGNSKNLWYHHPTGGQNKNNHTDKWQEHLWKASRRRTSCNAAYRAPSTGGTSSTHLYFLCCSGSPGKSLSVFFT